MIPVLTPEEMRAADARTIGAGTSGEVLMARAAAAVAWQVRRVLGGAYGRRVVVLCGKGNNGGDGRIAAARLAAWGTRADVVDCTATVTESTDRLLRRADAVVDAMFGTGFRGVLEGPAAELAEFTARTSATVVAVDIPSGVDGLTGEARGPAVRADHTVTFAAGKPGLWFPPGRELAGSVTVADIGIAVTGFGPTLGVVEESDVLGWMPRPSPTAHKWQSGVLVVGGSAGMTGAPVLAARAAMRLGAGIAVAGLPAGAARAAAGSEVITHALAEDGDGAIAASAAADILAMAPRFRAVVLGPGLGRHSGAAALVATLLDGIEVPVVLDADGLVALGSDLGGLRRRRGATVLTPHDGEFAALTGSRPDADRVARARSLAASAEATVLLKGPTTVVAEPDGTAWLNPTGTADLATAGSGDVLAGMIAAFCAHGMEPGPAAAAAAFVHGRAAARAGAAGFLAGELPALAAATVRSLTGREIHT